MRNFSTKFVPTISVLVLGIVLLFNIASVRASGSVGLSATVMERKPTDTINDFNYSSINPDVASGQVKGVSSSTVPPPDYWQVGLLTVSVLAMLLYLESIILKFFKRLKRRSTASATNVIGTIPEVGY